MMKKIFLVAILVINCTGFSLGASVATKMVELDSVIKGFEVVDEVLAELKDESSDESSKQKRVVMHMGTQESIAEVNAHAHTDEQIQQYCASHNCGLQGGDEILTNKQIKIEKEDNENAERARQRLAHDPIKRVSARWPKINGRVVVPYRFEPGKFTRRERGIIEKAMEEYRKYSCVDWVVVTDFRKHYVEFIKGGGCYSYVGKVNVGTGKQPISIGDGCAYPGTVVHEMLHCMGFFHEQSRPDRDQYVEIFLQNLENQDLKWNFRKQAAAGINTLGEPYDIGSVMHYGPDYFAKKGKFTILKKVPNQASVPFVPNRKGFSATDLRQLNKLYQCSNKPDPDPTCSMMLYLGFCRYSKISKVCPNECDAPKQQGYIKNFQNDNTCNRWAGEGYCDEDSRHAEYMQLHCLLTCINHKYSAVPQKTSSKRIR